MHGGFSQWSNWTDCSETCFGGSRVRVRYCNNPFPKFGGKDCVGSRKEFQGCNEEIRCQGRYNKFDNFTNCKDFVFLLVCPIT